MCLSRWNVKRQATVGFVLHKFINNTAESYINNEVILSNGERGRVVLLNKNFLSRPLVIAGNNTYDLSKMNDLYIENII